MQHRYEKIASELQINVELYEKLIQMFFEQAEEQISKIQVAMRQRDSQTMLRSLHFLKGSSCGLGLMNISLKVEEIEASVKKNCDVRLIDIPFKDLMQLVLSEKNKYQNL